MTVELYNALLVAVVPVVAEVVAVELYNTLLVAVVPVVAEVVADIFGVGRNTTLGVVAVVVFRVFSVFCNCTFVS